MRRAVLAGLTLLLGQAGPAWPAGPDLKIHFPPDGFRSSAGRVWLVFSAPVIPEVLLDGRVLRGMPQPSKGVYHVRLEGLAPAGTRVEVRAAGRQARLTVFGAGGNGQGFHTAAPRACWVCHAQTDRSCTDCHRWPAAAHQTAQPGSCSRCHSPKGALSGEVARLCASCHREYGGGKHPKLKHSLSAPRDPLRPDRPFDCVSCHDPHVPAALAAQRPEERREWCKGCHRR